MTCEVFVHFVSCEVFVYLRNVNFAGNDLCLRRILISLSWKGFPHHEILDLEVVVACVSYWLCPSVEFMRFVT